jgi:hypothetical protein
MNIEPLTDLKPPNEKVEFQLGSFSTYFKEVSWTNNLRELVQMFGDGIFSCCGLHKESKGEKAEELIEEFKTILLDHLRNKPERPPSDEMFPSHEMFPFSLSSSGLSDENISDPEPAHQNSVEFDSTKNDVEDKDTEHDRLIEVEFDCPVVEVEARGLNIQNHGNRMPFEGILFRIDEASETAPSKGSTLPLFIPREVAERAVDSVLQAEGLPLDADDSLTQHANNQIAGIMTRAEIRGKDFLVRGHLFPWSQKEKLDLIVANKDRLGMSMNARARGREAEVDGQKVFYIEELDLLGANILYSDHATYQKTRVFILGNAANEVAAEIAATSYTSINKEEEDMNTGEQLSQMMRTLQEISISTQQDSQKVQSQIEKMQEQIYRQETFLNEIQAERAKDQKEFQLSRTQEEKKREQEMMISAFSEVIEQKLADQKKEIMASINPSRSPRPLARSLVSLEAQGEQESNQSKQSNFLEKRLIAAQAKLEAYSEQGVTGSPRLSLIEEVRDLRIKLGFEGI